VRLGDFNIDPSSSIRKFFRQDLSRFSASMPTPRRHRTQEFAGCWSRVSWLSQNGAPESSKTEHLRSDDVQTLPRSRLVSTTSMASCRWSP